MLVLAMMVSYPFSSPLVAHLALAMYVRLRLVTTYSYLPSTYKATTSFLTPKVSNLNPPSLRVDTDQMAYVASHAAFRGTLRSGHLKNFLHKSPVRSKQIRAGMTTSTAQQASSSTLVEHIVLFNVKEGTAPDKTNAMVSALQALRALPMVSHLSVAPLKDYSYYTSTLNQDLKFTHALHSRYANKQDLADYSADPKHVSVVKNNVLPIASDIMALDWEAQPYGHDGSSPAYGALRVQLLKPKGDLDETSRFEVTEILKGYKDLFPCVGQVSFGENFSPARAKGFSLGLLTLFDGVKELEELKGNEEHVRIQTEKVVPAMESSLVFEYVVNPPYTANL